MVLETANLIVGAGVIILNLIPFILRKLKWLILTIAISLFLILALILV